MKKQRKSLRLADLITGVRILCGLLILFVPAFSERFYALYLLGGISDAVDGTVARKLGQETDFGAKQDTIADFAFALAVFVKIVRAVRIPVWLTVWAVLIIAVKTAGVIVGVFKYGGIVTVHSTLNRVCGGIVFLLPLIPGGSLAWQGQAAAAAAAGLIATAAAVAESIAIIKGKGTV